MAFVDKDAVTVNYVVQRKCFPMNPISLDGWVLQTAWDNRPRWDGFSRIETVDEGEKEKGKE